MKLFKKLRHLVDPLHLAKKIQPLIKLGIKTAPLWSSFIPGGSIGASLATKSGGLSKLAGFAARHPKVVGVVQKLRRVRETARTKPPHRIPSGFARMSTIHPANPYLNGRFAGTHIPRVRAYKAVPYQRTYRAQRQRGAILAERERISLIRQRRMRRAS